MAIKITEEIPARTVESEKRTVQAIIDTPKSFMEGNPSKAYRITIWREVWEDGVENPQRRHKIEIPFNDIAASPFGDTEFSIAWAADQLAKTFDSLATEAE